MLFHKMKTERAIKPRAGRGTDGDLGTQLSVSLGAPGCDGGRPLSGGPALAGDTGRSGSGPVLLAEQGPGPTSGVTGGLLGARRPIAPRAACASWQGPFSSGSALGAGEPRGHQDGAAPGPPPSPISSRAAQAVLPKDSSGPPHPRQAASGEAVAVPGPGSPLAAQALSRSPLKTGGTRLGVCGLLASAGSGGRGRVACGVGALLPTRPEGQPTHSLPWSSRVRICSGILWKGGCGRHAWCQALGEAGLCLHTQSPGELTESAEPPGPGDGGGCSRPPQWPDAPGGQQARYSAQFKGGDRGPGVAWTTPGRTFKLFPQQL